MAQPIVYKERWVVRRTTVRQRVLEWLAEIGEPERGVPLLPARDDQERVTLSQVELRVYHVKKVACIFRGG